MKDRSMTLGMGAAVVATLAVSIAMYSTARAQTATETQAPPAAGPRGITGAQDLQQRPNIAPQLAGGGGGSIAADQGMVYVLRGNAVFVMGRDPATGRFRVFDMVELPGGRLNPNGQTPFRPNGQQPTRPGGAPPPKK